MTNNTMTKRERTTKKNYGEMWHWGGHIDMFLLSPEKKDNRLLTTIICSYILAAHEDVVYILHIYISISQLIQYSRACGSYQDFLDGGLLLTRKLLNQGFLLFKLQSSPRKFYGRHHDLVN